MKNPPNHKKGKSKTPFTFKLLFTSLAFVISLTSLSAQRDYRWDKVYEPSPEIPLEFQNEDAVIIYNFEERQTLVQNNKPFTRDIVKRRYKILTQKGLDQYTRFHVKRRYNMGIQILDARTLKSDGTIVNLDAKEIKELEYNADKDLLAKDKYFLFSVPGVEVGDEVEIVATWEGSTLHSGDNIFPHETLPVLNSEFQLYLDERIIVFTAPVNGMPEPKVTQPADHFRFTWEMENLPGLYDTQGAIPGKTLPYFIYEFDYSLFYGNNRPDPISNWRELILDIDEKLSLRTTPKKLDVIMQDILGDKVKSSKMEQATIIHNYLNENIQLKRLEQNEKSGNVETYFTRKTADWTALISMYKAAFDWLGVNHYFGTGRSKFLGDIILEFPTDYQVTDYFYLIEEENGGIHIFPPKNGRRTWQVDEIPRHLRGTTIYMLSMQDKESFKQLTLQNNPFNQNQMQYKAKIDVNLAENKVSQQIEETYMGEVSTYYRDRMYEVEKTGNLATTLTESWAKKAPDTRISNTQISEYPTEQPFKFKLNFEAETPEQISEIEVGVYQLSVGNWLDHAILDVPKRKRFLDYHPRYAFMEGYNYFVNMTENATLQNKENVDIKVENEVGIYELSVNQVKPNAVSLRSRYIIKLNSIPANKMHLLDELNEAAKSASSAALILAKK